MRKITIAVATAAALASTAALASVSYDPATGGFVGKGDVQTVLGLNNAQMNTAANGVTFTYDIVASYEFTCEWTTGEGTKGQKTHTVDHTTSLAVQSSVARDLRKNPNNNLTGFTLYAVAGGGEDTPDIACPGTDGTGAEVVEGSVVQTSSSAGLFFHYGTGSYPLPNTL